MSFVDEYAAFLLDSVGVWGVMSEAHQYDALLATELVVHASL